MPTLAERFLDVSELEDLLDNLRRRHILLTDQQRTSELDTIFASYVQGRDGVRIVIPERLDQPVRLRLPQENPHKARKEFGARFFEAIGKSLVVMPEIRSPRSEASANDDRASLKTLQEMLDAHPQAMGFSGVAQFSYDSQGNEKTDLRRAYVIFEDELSKQTLKTCDGISFREAQRAQSREERAEQRRSLRGNRTGSRAEYDLPFADASLRAAHALNNIYLEANEKDRAPEPPTLRDLVGRWARVTGQRVNEAYTTGGIGELVRGTGEWRLARRTQGAAMQSGGLPGNYLLDEISDGTRRLRQAETRIFTLRERMEEATSDTTRAALAKELEKADAIYSQLARELSGREAMGKMVGDVLDAQAKRVTSARTHSMVDSKLAKSGQHDSLIDEKNAVQTLLDNEMERLRLQADDRMPALAWYMQMAHLEEQRRAIGAMEQTDPYDVIDPNPPLRSMSLDLGVALDSAVSFPEQRDTIDRIAAGTATREDLASYDRALALGLPVAAIEAFANNADIASKVNRNVADSLRLLAVGLESGEPGVIEEIVRSGERIRVGLEGASSNLDPQVRALPITPLAMDGLLALANKVQNGERIQADFLAKFQDAGLYAFGALPDGIASREALVQSYIDKAATREHQLRGTVPVSPTELRAAVVDHPLFGALGAKYPATYPDQVVSVVLQSRKGIEAYVNKLPGEVRKALAGALRSSDAERTQALQHAVEAIRNPEDRQRALAVALALDLQERTAMAMAEMAKVNLDPSARGRALKIAPYLSEAGADAKRFVLPVVSDRQARLNAFEGKVVAFHGLFSNNDGSRIYAKRVGLDDDVSVNADLYARDGSIDSFSINRGTGRLIAVTLAVVERPDGQRAVLPVPELDTARYGQEKATRFAGNRGVAVVEAFVTQTPIEIKRAANRRGLGIALPELERGSLVETTRTQIQENGREAPAEIGLRDEGDILRDTLSQDQTIDDHTREIAMSDWDAMVSGFQQETEAMRRHEVSALIDRAPASLEPFAVEGMPSMRMADVSSHPVPTMVSVAFTPRPTDPGFVLAEQTKDDKSIWHRVPVDVVPEQARKVVEQGGIASGWLDLSPRPFGRTLAYSLPTPVSDDLNYAYERAVMARARQVIGERGYSQPDRLSMVTMDDFRKNEGVASFPETRPLELAFHTDTMAYYVTRPQHEHVTEQNLAVVEVPIVSNTSRTRADGTQMEIGDDSRDDVAARGVKNSVRRDAQIEPFILPTVASLTIERGRPILLPDFAQAEEGHGRRSAVIVPTTPGLPTSRGRGETRAWSVIENDLQHNKLVMVSEPLHGGAPTGDRMVVAAIDRSELANVDEVEVGMTIVLKDNHSELRAAAEREGRDMLDSGYYTSREASAAITQGKRDARVEPQYRAVNLAQTDDAHGSREGAGSLEIASTR